MRTKTIFLLMAAALVMGFAACSDKDDEGMENNDPGAINKNVNSIGSVIPVRNDVNAAENSNPPTIFLFSGRISR